MRRTTLFASGSYAAVQDPKSGAVFIEFVEAHLYGVVRFALLEKEKDRYADEAYVNGLIDAYHKDPAKFGSKRRVSKP